MARVHVAVGVLLACLLLGLANREAGDPEARQAGFYLVAAEAENAAALPAAKGDHRVVRYDYRHLRQGERGQPLYLLLPMYQEESPTEVRILEIYASRESYEAHLKTPHFQRYKTTTLKMVKSLRLVDMEVMDTHTMTTIFRRMK